MNGIILDALVGGLSALSCALFVAGGCYWCHCFFKVYEDGMKLTIVEKVWLVLATVSIALFFAFIPAAVLIDRSIREEVSGGNPQCFQELMRSGCTLDRDCYEQSLSEFCFWL